ncbi:MAG TPA: STAS domain-containing protein [Candidatus Limnocylindria bacterium]|nr:STAS domain-containing protein [Candidatus Limnocylindria bacterium]
MSGERIVELDVAGVARPDMSTVDHLCRVAYHARRLGVELRLRGVSSELHELLDLAGVCDVCGCPAVVPPDERG